MKSPTFPSSQPIVVALYAQDYSCILRSALKPDALTEQLLNLREQTSRTWIAGEEFAFLQQLFQAVQRIRVPTLDPAWFQSVGHRITPILKRPEFLNHLLPQPAHQVLREQLGQQQGKLVQTILDRSCFNDTDLRYRTDFHNGELCIFGASLPTLSSLASLTHEIGHAFVETRCSENDLHRQIISEAFAQCLEEFWIEAFLPKQAWKQEWREFQSRIDQLNFHFFLWEMSQTQRFSDLHLLPFDAAALLLRETVFTAFGYQAIYAMASWIRYRLRAKRHGNF